MAVVTFSCPECGKVLKSTRGTPTGKKIKCPTCAAVFPMPAGDDEELAAGVSAKPRAPAAAAPARDEDEPRPRRRRVDDDDDDDEDRPRRKKKAAAKRRSGSSLPLLIGVGAVVLLLAAASIGVGVYFLWSSGINKGSGNEEPLAYVPSGTEVLVGVDYATLLSDPTLGPPLEKAMRQDAKSGDFFESCKKETGLEPKELLGRALICTDFDSFNQGGPVGGGAAAAALKGMTMILRPSRPFDQKKIARSCKDPVRKTAHGKYYYDITEGNLRTLFMPSDRTLILSTLTADQLGSLFASDGTTPSVSPDTLALARGVSSSSYSAVIPFEGQVRSKLDDEVRQGKGNQLNPMQPMMEQVAKGKGMAAWGTVDGQQVKLGVNVLYPDAAAAKTAAQSAESSWGANKFALALGLGVLKAQMPKIVEMLSQLTQSLKFTSEGPMTQLTAVVGRTALADGIAEAQTMQQNGGALPGFNPGAGGGPAGGFKPNPGGGRPGGRR